MIELNEEMAQIERDLVRKNQLLALAQSQLVQTEKMASIGQLAAGVAHEINNPIGFVYSNLTSLEGYLRDLFSALDACARGEEATRLEALWQELDLDFLRQDIPLLLGESRTGIARVKDIVQNLRDFAHIDGDSNWQWETLPRCLDSTLEVLRGAISGKIEIVREYGETPEIECQPSQLNQAFMNILLNAAQSIEGKGVIRVRTGQEGEQVRVEISDSGSGIAPDILPRIFEPCFTTRPVGTGTGLGLSAAFNIIAQHQGRIAAESTPGKGTLVRIRLPIRRQAHD
ncbi:MAG: ATP-binding protein [Sulfuricella sp.]